MSIKSLLVHLSFDKDHSGRLMGAVALAKRFGAHLTVIYASGRPGGSDPHGIGRPSTLAYLETAAKTEEMRVQTVHAEAVAACAVLPSWEWREVHGPISKLVSPFASLADLMIAEEAPPAVDDLDLLSAEDLIVLAAVCPVLLVPENWNVETLGQRVLVAWKNVPEAARAVRGAVPFLETAEEVVILAAHHGKADKPGSELIAYLNHHGIGAKLVGVSKEGGEDILVSARDNNCDMIVMGVYGHPRLRKMMLGGSTQHILCHSTLPVLMHH